MNKTCSVKDCENKHLAKGYCSKHYQGFKKHGDPLAGIENERHGMEGTVEYRSWAHMKQRCLNKNDKDYQYYGGRGIRICKRWKSFAAFYADMGPRPSLKHQLDRKDNDGNYEPGNVIWVLSCINSRNRRSTKLDVEKVKSIRELHAKKVCTLEELAVRFGVSRSTIGRIIRYVIWENVA